MRNINLPVEGASPILVLLRFNQISVRDDNVRLRDRGEQFAGDEVVGMIVAGKPVVIVFGFALRPDLTRSAGVIIRRLDICQTLPIAL